MKSKPKLESKSKSKSEPKPKSNPIAIEAESPSEFAFAVARTAVSQICQSVGFKSAQLSALHTLTAVAAAYLQAAAKSSASLAAAANRTDSNLLDLAAALHDLRSGAALSAAPAAAAEADRCPLRSSALADIAAFVRSTPETPFAKPVPRRRRHRRPNSAPGGIGSVNGPIPRPPHVPHWLPEAPETAVAKGERGGGGGGGEELWEDRVGRGGIGVVVVGEEGGEREGKLEERGERERVRFKVGVGLRSGVSKGGKIRVCWDNHNRIRNGLNNNGGCLGVVESDYMVKHDYDGSS